MSFRFAQDINQALPLWLIEKEDAGPIWPADLDKSVTVWADASGFSANPGETCLLPDADGNLKGALFGLGKPETGPGARRRFTLAKAVDTLPGHHWHIAAAPEGWNAFEGALGWGLGYYRFDRYKKTPDRERPLLVAPEGIDTARIEAMVTGEWLTRTLINTPASDMGPDALETAARAVGHRHGAEIEVITGDDLARDFPMIHAVGRAGAVAPRLIDLRFGGEGPTLTLVGKGVCFDTGGLDIKPPSSMALMKKDMGGAATVLGLANMLASLGETDRMRLRVLIPAVENSIAGNAMRPGDVLTSRKGLTVEINNTDAEGRLVLGDALAYGAEENPDCMISMATLTGAARVALGPDLPPFFCDDDKAAAALAKAGDALCDPIWRMPFWAPYEAMIEPQIADLDNAPAGGFAGAITAALFLRRFAEGARRYAHFDIYGWQPKPAPGRPKGGAGQGARAILGALPELLS